MVRPAAKDSDKVIETWEACTEGTYWLWVYDRRDDRYNKERVGGREGSRRLHISRDDRKYNQEQIPLENKGLDPFTNGALRLIEAADRDESLDTRYHFTNEQLGEMFELRDDTLFSETVHDIESELIVRRLCALGEKVGTARQNEILREMCTKRWPIGGTQRSVQELIDAGERIGATQMY